MRRKIVVVGTSAGGIEALRSIVSALPRDFPVPICAVLHVGADSPGILGMILSRAGRMPCVTVTDSEAMQPGTIYVARPDHHLIVEPSRVIVTRGPRENRFRPAVDPLFRSAAQTYGPGAIGVILTGGLDDGTAGLWAVKQLGGVAVVQDPDEALVDSMPRNAIAHVAVDHVARLAEIPALLERLAAEDIAQMGGYAVPEPIRIEVDIASESAPLRAGVQALGAPSTFACPECHGVLLKVKEGERERFRCHTGHAYTAEALISELDTAIETSLWNSLRALQEKTLLVRHLAEHARGSGDAARLASLQQSIVDAEARADVVRGVTMNERDPHATRIPPHGASAGEAAREGVPGE